MKQPLETRRRPARNRGLGKDQELGSAHARLGRPAVPQKRARKVRPLDFAEINQAALAAFPVVLTRILPGGEHVGAELVAIDPSRADRRTGSFKIKRYNGRWADFATGDKGGDPISLVAYLVNLSQGGETRSIAARKAGFKNRETYRQAKAARDAGRDEPERFGKALADMNRTGRVHGPFKWVKIAKQSDEIRREPPPLPGEGPYRVIIVDPPWHYEKRDEDPSHRGVLPYPTMSIAQIAALPVADIAHEDCVLWLCTTNAHMRESLRHPGRLGLRAEDHSHVGQGSVGPW
jgi:MT-A70 protein